MDHLFFGIQQLQCPSHTASDSGLPFPEDDTSTLSVTGFVVPLFLWHRKRRGEEKKETGKISTIYRRTSKQPTKPNHNFKMRIHFQQRHQRRNISSQRRQPRNLGVRPNFEIDTKNYFMTSDGKWNSNNPIGTHLHQVKSFCHLLPVRRDDEFSYSANDFPAIMHHH